MKSEHNPLQIVWLLLFTLIAGAIGYHLIEHWSWLDAIYMTVITLATVGYGETHSLSDLGRVFTMILIMGGMGVLLYCLSELTEFVVQGGILGILRRRSMERTLKKISHHYILCGMGKSGQHVLEELLRTKRKVVVVEKNHEKVQELLSRNIPTIEGDASSDTVLRNARIEHAEGLVTTLPEDKDNLFVIITARGLNPDLRIVAKAEDVRVREKFLRSGANSAISASYIGGLRMASELVRPETTTFLDTMLRDDSALRVDEVTVGTKTLYSNKPLRQCDVVKSSGAVLVSMRKHANQQFIFNPPQETVLETGDTLIFIGNPAQLSAIRSTLSK
jgi:voltage-gated potassium channel